jgi:hypothetical protein
MPNPSRSISPSNQIPPLEELSKTLSPLGESILKAIAIPHWLGYSEKEIAKWLGIGPTFVRSLREELANEIENETANETNERNPKQPEIRGRLPRVPQTTIRART